MNTHSACAMLVATFGAALALVNTAAVAAKPGGGGSTDDPCSGAEARGFPSFVFTKQVGTTWGIFVADANAQCQRQVGAYPSSRTVNFRYDPTARTGVLVHDADGSKLVAATISTAFSATGSPTVKADAFETLISVADLPDPEQAAWGPLKYIGSPVVSPNGDAILFGGSSAAGGDDRIFWVCSLNIDVVSAAVAVNASTCKVAHRAPSTGMGATATWGARPGTIYVTQTAASGYGGSLYRLTLPTLQFPAGSFKEIWSRGTEFTYAKATLASGVERVAVYEPDVTNLCSKVWVINADLCPGNSCSVLNGQGNPARSVGWLPDGRVVAEGQTAPGRRGKCSPAGTVVSFEATDLTSSATTLTKGVYPEGAGGG
jgi:hypothetical protein